MAKPGPLPIGSIVLIVLLVVIILILAPAALTNVRESIKPVYYTCTDEQFEYVKELCAQKNRAFTGDVVSCLGKVREVVCDATTDVKANYIHRKLTLTEEQDSD